MYVRLTPCLPSLLQNVPARNTDNDAMATVLVVDDDEGFALGIAEALRAHRHRVLVENDGDAALVRMAGQRVDVALCDIVMPGLLGPGFMQKAQSTPGHEELPVVFMSTLPESRVNAMFDGYAAYVQKPFSVPELLATLDRVLASSVPVFRGPAVGAAPVFRVR